MPHIRQKICTDETGRACSDNGYAESGGGPWLNHRNGILIPQGIIPDKPFHGTDGQRLIYLGTAAVVLTWMGTYTSVHCGEGVILADQAVSILDPSGCQHGHIAGYKYIGRAGVAAGR